MTWVGLDDTDRPDGGCSTYVLTEVIRAARGLGFDLIGEPRLVRLDPNVPFKTRGNGALAARFGHGTGPSRRVGAIGSAEIRAYHRGRALTPTERTRLFEAAWAAVRSGAGPPGNGTDPAVVLAPRPLPSGLYRLAVARRIAIRLAERQLGGRGNRFRTARSRRGLVGAAAAIAWPARRATFELLAYRAPDRIGQPRRIAVNRIPMLERRFPELFLCSDRRTRRVLISPHTDCPILFGLRATRPGRLARAAAGLAREPVDRWMIFRTNQGTGDHRVPRAIGELRPFDAAVIEGHVRTAPEVVAGGHVRFELRDRAGAVAECWAFEPTKTLPGIAQRLRAGDRLRVWGGRGADPIFRLEGIEVRATVPRWTEGPNPSCPECGRRMKSLGHGRGFRCRHDGHRAAPEARRRVRISGAPPVGTYHPTPSARRHLHPRAEEPGRPPAPAVRASTATLRGSGRARARTRPPTTVRRGPDPEHGI